MKGLKKYIPGFLIVLFSGLVPAILIQFFAEEPVSRKIHVRSFRYGKDPSVIRCNRGDTIHLTFSTDDTGHSFFLEEFDMDVKVSPALREVSLFRAKDPTVNPVITEEVTFIARHKGIMNFIASKSNFRCHVWCGPMHAFEQGKLVIFPNTLLTFSFGSLLGIFFITLRGSGKDKRFNINYNKYNNTNNNINNNINIGAERKGYKEITQKGSIAERLIKSRWPQALLVIFALLMIYVVILTATFGTKVSGRNLGVLLMWTIWLFILVALLTPLGGRLWCTICPLPFFGDLFQRGSVFLPIKGRTKNYNNRFRGFFLKWPQWLSNGWPRLFVFMILATFSTTLVAVPAISGITVLFLLVIPILMSMVWELRAFCRYVCPVSVFVSPYSGLSMLALRNRSQAVCDGCKGTFCQTGSSEGWACPYGLNVAELNENSDCGLCLECTRSCPYNNVTLYRRPFASEASPKNTSQSWMVISLFTVSVVYSILYLGHWPIARDYVNIIDKAHWDLFGIYTLILWSAALVVMPGLVYVTSFISDRFSGKTGAGKIFPLMAGSLLPLGLAIWIAFVVQMLFVNKTFIIQSLSDPFGWGWDFFGTANIPWKQLWPEAIPWIQSMLILTGMYFSMKKVSMLSHHLKPDHNKSLRMLLPGFLLIAFISALMILFYTS